MVSPYDPTQPDLTDTFATSSWEHPLGTDNFGRDILTRILAGGRIDLFIAFMATSVTFVLGTILGSVAGYYGRWIDVIVMRSVDIAVAFPFLVLIIAIVAMLGPGRNNIFIAIWLVGWIAYARIVRGEILLAKQLEYSEAAKVMGNSDFRIISAPPDAKHHHGGTDIRDGRYGLEHPRGCIALIPGTRRPAALSRVGSDDRRGP